MRTTVFLALNKRGLVKATKGRAGLGRDEIGVMLTVSVPDKAFLSPYVSASLDVPDHAVEVPEILIDVAENRK